MTKKDILLISEIYDRTRVERPERPEEERIPQEYLDQITDMIDRLEYAFVEKPMIEKHVVKYYGEGYVENFNKLKECITEFLQTWENILYEIDPGPDDN